MLRIGLLIAKEHLEPAEDSERNMGVTRISLDAGTSMAARDASGYPLFTSRTRHGQMVLKREEQLATKRAALGQARRFEATNIIERAATATFGKLRSPKPEPFGLGGHSRIPSRRQPGSQPECVHARLPPFRQRLAAA